MARRPTTKRTTNADGTTTVHGKLANGAGSVYFDHANGCYFATWRDSAGKRRKVRGKSQAEAVQRRDAAIDNDAATAGPGISRFTAATTVYEMGQWWLDNDAVNSVRPSSLGAMRTRVTRARLGALADVPVVELTSEQVQTWQNDLLRGSAPLAPKTVADTRLALRQAMECAVTHKLIAANPVAKVKPPKVDRKPGRHLDPADAQRLVAACADHRYGAVVAILFAQGWRVSEVLGLAWGDLDLDADEPTATVRRAVVQVAGVGKVLGPPKSDGAEGVHHLSPGVVARLRARRAAQNVERLAAGPSWQNHEYDGAPIDLVFTTESGALVGRQTISRLLTQHADALGIDVTNGLGTHAGRRTVVTALSESGATLDDIAEHVGHRSTKTTAGYVGNRSKRKRATAERAAAILDVPAAV